MEMLSTHKFQSFPYTISRHKIEKTSKDIISEKILLLEPKYEVFLQSMSWENFINIWPKWEYYYIFVS